MALGVDKTKEMIEGAAELVVDAISFVKAGPSLSSFSKIIEILSDLKVVVASAPHVLPELQDLDAAESGVLGSVAYDAVKKIVLAVAK